MPQVSIKESGAVTALAGFGLLNRRIRLIHTDRDPSHEAI